MGIIDSGDMRHFDPTPDSFTPMEEPPIKVVGMTNGLPVRSTEKGIKLMSTLTYPVVLCFKDGNTKVEYGMSLSWMACLGKVRTPSSLIRKLSTRQHMII